MKYKENLSKGASKKIFDNAKELRKGSTNAEIILWEALRKNNILGLKFRRQHPLGEFIADFYCHELKLVIELDGSIHNVHKQSEYDKTRTSELIKHGLNVLRIKNKEVEDNITFVLEKIRSYIQTLPSPKGEGSGVRQKVRLDILLTENGLSPTRTKAQALIMSGNVLVNEKKIDKPGTLVPADSVIRILGDNNPYVSRGGLKLEGALKEFGYDPKDKLCLDIGASTGGFTDCLLQKGAKQVIALDVGHDQIDYKLRTDPRVTVIEKFNAREISKDKLLEYLGVGICLPAEASAKAGDLGFNLVVMDVSFISITKILPALKQILSPGTDIISLVKPQFEAEKKQVEKGGLITDPIVHEQVLAKVKNTVVELGFEYLGFCISPLTGADGNKEFFIHLKV